VTDDEPLDSGDVDALLELERSRGYQLVCDRILQQLDCHRGRLEAELLPAPTQYERGYIAALRMVLTVPKILKGEIKT